MKQALVRHVSVILTGLLVASPAPLQTQTAQVAAPRTAASASLPERLSDAEFWKLVTDISEPGGFFRMTDNYVSNERDIGLIAGMITANGPRGGVYLGVGPEQNLTYIVAVRPKMAFIVDIRRQAVIHHLMYKAIFELSRDRVDFISLLFARPRPDGIASDAGIIRIWEQMVLVPTDTTMAAQTLARLRDHLTRTHGFALTPDELASLDHVYNSFVRFGPQITTNGGGGIAIYPNTGALLTAGDSIRAAQLRVAQAQYDSALAARLRTAAAGSSWVSVGAANFMSLTSVTDAAGQFNSFLGSDEAFRFLKDLHTRNLFVPNSGNFGGPKAIRAVGNYVRQHGALISAFYVSNVEQYLFSDGIAGIFYDNVGTLPVDESSVFIRPGGFRTQVALCPIAAMLRAVASGRVTGNATAVSCSRQ